MDKLNVFKDGMTHGLDSFTLIHKQTLDSSLEYAEKYQNLKRLNDLHFTT